MRANVRTSRRFRPMTDHLEGLNPVSTLIPGVAMTAPQPVGLGGRLDAGSTTAQAGEMRGYVAPTLSPPDSPRVPARVSASVAYQVATPSEPITPVGVAQVAPVSKLGTEWLQPSSIDTAMLSATSPVPGPNGLTTGQAPAGAAKQAGNAAVAGSAIPQSTRPVATAPIGSSPSRPTTPDASVSAFAPTAPGRGTIRPLSMAPTDPQASHDGEGEYSTLDDSGGSGGSGGTIAEQYGPPTLGVYSGDIIGGFVGATVAAPAGMDVLKSVTWSVTGAMSGQDYRNIQGTTTALTTPITHTWGGGSVEFDSLNFYWDATPGNHTISVSVIYSDGSTASASKTVSVAKPTVNFFNVSYTAATGEFAQNVVNGQIAMNITYNASVSLPVGLTEGGAFSIIQKISWDHSSINADPNVGANVTHTLSTGWILDNYPGNPPGTGDNSPGYLLGNSSVAVPVGGTATRPTPWTDHPNFDYVNTVQSGTCLEYWGTLQLQPYLVFRPEGGIWVKLAEVNNPIVMSGNMEWNEAANKFEVVGTLAPASGSGGNVGTTNSTGFVSWQKYLTKEFQYPNYSPPIL